MRISDWSSDVCSSDLRAGQQHVQQIRRNRFVLILPFRAPRQDSCERTLRRHRSAGASLYSEAPVDKVAKGFGGFRHAAPSLLKGIAVVRRLSDTEFSLLGESR